MIENTLPESLIRVFPAWAYCQLWLSSTAIVKQKTALNRPDQSRPKLDST